MVCVVVVLILGSLGDEFSKVGIERRTIYSRPRQDPIDNVASWLCLFTLVFGVVAYYWTA
jgi:hypothetical protein